MSRCYKLQLEIAPVPDGDLDGALRRLAHRQFSGGEPDSQWSNAEEGVVYCEGLTTLGGGMGEKEAHEVITAEFKAQFPELKIITRWLYEERDWDCTFGEEPEGDPSEPGHPDNPRSEFQAQD